MSTLQQYENSSRGCGDEYPIIDLFAAFNPRVVLYPMLYFFGASR
jgi:hypothetical protein